MTGLADDVRRASDRASVLIDREGEPGQAPGYGADLPAPGWIPRSRGRIRSGSCPPTPAPGRWGDPAEEEYPQVPVSLKNNWLTRPLNMVTEMYSLPAYGTVDPNP